MDDIMFGIAKSIGDAMRAETGEWTPDCCDPEDLIALADSGGSHPQARKILAHLAVCAYCRREYLETELALSTAPRFRIEPARQALRFNWRTLAASSTDDRLEFTGLLCDDTLRVTLWLDGGSAILTVVSLAAPGSRSATLVRYVVTSPAKEIEGYFPVPDAGRAVELDLGTWKAALDGDIECRYVDAADLQDPDVARESVLRCRDLQSQRGWKEMLRLYPDAWPIAVRSTIHEAIEHA